MHSPRIALRVLHEQMPSCSDSVSGFLQYFHDVYRGLASTQKQDRKLMSFPRLLSFSWIQCRFVAGHLTAHNTLRKHLYKTGLKAVPYVEGVEPVAYPEMFSEGGGVTTGFFSEGG
jgi:hypothetical protein